MEWLPIGGPRYPSIDHVEPRSKGGSLAGHNKRLAHRVCNEGIRNNGAQSSITTCASLRPAP